MQAFQAARGASRSVPQASTSEYPARVLAVRLGAVLPDHAFTPRAVVYALSRPRRCGGVLCATAPPANKPAMRFRGVPSSFSSDGVQSVTAAGWASWDTGEMRPPKLTRSDAYFQEQGLEFLHGPEGIQLPQLNELFEKVGFPRRDTNKLALALAQTHRIVWIRCTRTSRIAKEGQMVGFARATGDGVQVATVWDVSVDPAWQRNGLGRALMERLTRRLVEDGISVITLYAEPKVVSMYEKLGFIKEDRVKGMGFMAGKPRKQAAVAA